MKILEFIFFMSVFILLKAVKSVTTSITALCFFVLENGLFLCVAHTYSHSHTRRLIETHSATLPALFYLTLSYLTLSYLILSYLTLPYFTLQFTHPLHGIVDLRHTICPQCDLAPLPTPSEALADTFKQVLHTAAKVVYVMLCYVMLCYVMLCCAW